MPKETMRSSKSIFPVKTVTSTQIYTGPQVAAYANRHFFVEKYEDDQKMTQTTVSILKGKESLEEIARMLSGDQVSPEARAAASQLLDVAQKIAA